VPPTPDAESPEASRPCLCGAREVHRSPAPTDCRLGASRQGAMEGRPSPSFVPFAAFVGAIWAFSASRSTSIESRFRDARMPFVGRIRAPRSAQRRAPRRALDPGPRLLTFAIESSSAVFYPARDAFLPALVAPEDLSHASALVQTSSRSSSSPCPLGPPARDRRRLPARTRRVAPGPAAASPRTSRRRRAVRLAPQLSSRPVYDAASPRFFAPASSRKTDTARGTTPTRRKTVSAAARTHSSVWNVPLIR